MRLAPHRRITLDDIPGLTAFVTTHHARLVGALALYVGDVGVAEELAQDAEVKLCRHWSRVAGMQSPTGWLHRVAFNLAASWHRRRFAERRAMARHGGDAQVVREEPADVLAVRSMVAELPPRRRQAIVCRYFLDLTVAETAAVMGIADATVRALTHQAIATLRERDLLPLTTTGDDDG